MIDSDEVMLLSGLIAGILFDLFLVFRVSFVDSYVTGTFLVLVALLRLIV